MDNALQQLHAVLREIWQSYQDAGPGNLDQNLLAPLEEATPGALDAARDNAELTAAINTAVDLAERCVKHSQGLCFVTGEAGLLPRKDLHEKMETALSVIQQASL